MPRLARPEFESVSVSGSQYDALIWNVVVIVDVDGDGDGDGDGDDPIR